MITNKKHVSTSSLKKKVWKLCSIYNRRKDADTDGYVRCATCGERKHWKEVDAGHFRDGRWNSILFYDNGIHAQCKPCNGRLRNRTVDNVDRAYEVYMRKRYGKYEIKKIDALKKTTKQFTVQELKGLIETYKEKINELLKTI